MKGIALLLLCAAVAAQANLICSPDLMGVLMPHPHCDQFYMCFFGSKTEMSCSHGLLFNPEHQVCDWPENVVCGDRIMPKTKLVTERKIDIEEEVSEGNKDPSQAPAICAAEDSDGILVAHEHCNQFYTCYDGKPLVMDCPENLVYNPKKEYCDWDYKVDCGNRIIPEVVSAEKPEAEKSSEELSEGNNDPSQAPIICAAEDSDGILVAHENCNEYYKCIGRQPVAMECPENLVYNPKKEYCDWTWNVDCSGRTRPDEVNIGKPNEEKASEESCEGNNDPSQAPAICAAEDSDGILVAHEHCNQFYTCYDGKPLVMDCPDNLLFNPKKEYCDWYYNVDCGDRIIPEVVSTEKPEAEKSSEESSEGNNDPSQAPIICAADDSDGILVAHENCNEYYKCYSGQPLPMECPEDLLYNPKKEYCDWPWNVDCGNRVVPSEKVFAGLKKYARRL